MSGPKKAKFEQYTPPDLQGLRGQQINLLQSLFSGNGTGANSLFAQLFGDMGSNPTALQAQSTQAASNYLSQPAPEQQALNTAMPFLQNLLANNPGQGMLDALKPSFDRNLAQANQQGGRFASGNAILRSRAVDDYNLLGAQALQQGHSQQLQGVDALRLLSGQAGQNPFSRIMGAGQMGASDAAQADLGTQRRLQMLAQLLGVGQQAALGGPIVQTQAASGGFGGLLGGLLGTGLGAFAGGAGAAIGGNIGRKVGGG